MFGRKSKRPKQWLVPGGNAYRLYLDMLEQPHIYFLGNQSTDRDLLRDGLIYTALLTAPSSMNFVLVDLCGIYMHDYRRLPHTKVYTSDLDESVKVIERIDLLVNERLRYLAKNKNQVLSTTWVVVDGFDGLSFKYKKLVENMVSSILLKGRGANVHLALFSSYSKLSGGLDEMFPAYVFLNGSGTADTKIRKLTGTKGFTTSPGRIVYKNYQCQCADVAIPQISCEEITERIKWWKDQRYPKI